MADEESPMRLLAPVGEVEAPSSSAAALENVAQELLVAVTTLCNAVKILRSDGNTVLADRTEEMARDYIVTALELTNHVACMQAVEASIIQAAQGLTQEVTNEVAASESYETLSSSAAALLGHGAPCRAGMPGEGKENVPTFQETFPLGMAGSGVLHGSFSAYLAAHSQDAARFQPVHAAMTPPQAATRIFQRDKSGLVLALKSHRNEPASPSVAAPKAQHVSILGGMNDTGMTEEALHARWNAPEFATTLLAMSETPQEGNEAAAGRIKQQQVAASANAMVQGQRGILPVRIPGTDQENAIARLAAHSHANARFQLLQVATAPQTGSAQGIQRDEDGNDVSRWRSYGSAREPASAAPPSVQVPRNATKNTPSFVVDMMSPPLLAAVPLSAIRETTAHAPDRKRPPAGRAVFPNKQILAHGRQPSTKYPKLIYASNGCYENPTANVLRNKKNPPEVPMSLPTTLAVPQISRTKNGETLVDHLESIIAASKSVAYLPEVVLHPNRGFLLVASSDQGVGVHLTLEPNIKHADAQSARYVLLDYIIALVQSMRTNSVCRQIETPFFVQSRFTDSDGRNFFAVSDKDGNGVHMVLSVITEDTQASMNILYEYFLSVCNTRPPARSP